MSRLHTPRCGAQLSHGRGQCKHPAGWGTDHRGEGYCKLHGGASPNHKKALAAAAERQRVGQELDSPRIRELFESFRDAQDPTNVLDELALLRALLIDYVNRHAEMQDAVLRWHASFEPAFRKEWADVAGDLDAALELGAWDEYQQLIARLPNPDNYMQRPRKLPDLGEAHKLILTVSTLTDRIEKQRELGMVPVGLLLGLLKELASVAVGVARESITDPVERAAFISQLTSSWQSVRLERGEAVSGSPGDGATTVHVN